MAGGVNAPWRALAVGLALTSFAASATAENLRDPTRPAIFQGGPRMADKGPTAAWVLQSVLISPERRYAIINGEVVSPGELVGGALLLAIAEGRVTLRTSEGVKTVNLFPDVFGRASKGRTPAIEPVGGTSAPAAIKKQESGTAGPKSEQ